MLVIVVESRVSVRSNLLNLYHSQQKKNKLYYNSVNLNYCCYSKKKKECIFAKDDKRNIMVEKLFFLFCFVLFRFVLFIYLFFLMVRFTF